jgi:hypothetical protein
VYDAIESQDDALGYPGWVVFPLMKGFINLIGAVFKEPELLGQVDLQGHQSFHHRGFIFEASPEPLSFEF